MCVKQIRASLADAPPKPGTIYEVLKAIFKVFICMWLSASMNLVSCAMVSESEHKGFVCIWIRACCNITLRLLGHGLS